MPEVSTKAGIGTRHWTKRRCTLYVSKGLIENSGNSNKGQPGVVPKRLDPLYNARTYVQWLRKTFDGFQHAIRMV